MNEISIENAKIKLTAKNNVESWGCRFFCDSCKKIGSLQRKNIKNTKNKTYTNPLSNDLVRLETDQWNHSVPPRQTPLWACHRAMSQLAITTVTIPRLAGCTFYEKTCFETFHSLLVVVSFFGNCVVVLELILHVASALLSCTRLLCLVTGCPISLKMHFGVLT